MRSQLRATPFQALAGCLEDTISARLRASRLQRRPRRRKHLCVQRSQGRPARSRRWIRRRLLRSLGNRWEQLWPRIGWKEAGTWTRYPKGFTWSLDAPEGHMPLVNQLRGVRLMDALLSHPGVQQRMPS